MTREEELAPNPPISVVCGLTMLLLVSGSTVGFAKPQSNTSVAIAGSFSDIGTPPLSNISLAIAGSFSDVGSQHYSFAGGKASSVNLTGVTPPASLIDLSYSVNASVQGTSVSGSAEFQLNGTGPLANLTSLEGHAELLGMIPAVGLPITNESNLLACALDSSCTSELPGLFIGQAEIRGTLNGSSVTVNATLLFESPYLNPFGGLLFIGSPDGSISMVSTYNSAIAQWSGVKTSGDVFNVGGGDRIGRFAVWSNLTEDLFAGTEGDRGQIVLSNFTGANVFLNSAGDFSGLSTIPQTPGPDCTLSLGTLIDAIFGTTLTLPSNTCTITGSNSQGSFALHGSIGRSEIDGQYVNNWSEPAVSFVGAINATLPLHRLRP